MSTATFAGLPVTGDITKTNRTSVVQRPKEELEPLIRTLLDSPGVEAIRWTQYTPFFNDGEPCEFGVNDVYVRLDVSEDEDGEEEDGFLYESDPKVRGGAREHWDRDTRSWVKTGVTYKRHACHGAFDALRKAIPSGAFDNALLELFGDHAQITVTREGIEVEYYEHE